MCSLLNLYPAHYSTDFLCQTCKVALQKWAITKALIINRDTWQEVSDCKQKSNGNNIQSFGLALGNFSMNQILLALHKHIRNLALCVFQMHFEWNVIFMDSLFMTPELLQKTLQELTLSNYIWPLWEEREQVSMSILQLLKEQNLLLSLGIQHRNFNYLIPLHSSMVTSSHLLRILLLQLWLVVRKGWWQNNCL